MQFKKTKFDDCFLIKPKVFVDVRGHFFETFRDNVFKKYIGKEINFVQHSHSNSKKGVLRGLHYQKKNPQGKLVRVVKGEIFDVAVDIRKSSKDFGKWIGFYLSDKNYNQFWIPPGFAHGFCVTSEVANITYRLTDYYDPTDSHIINWNDPDIEIDWPLDKPILSEKDQSAPYLRDIEI
tara:strand:- start:491 stop:1027 length:537 start_codon:yes stop_codon:yes gene_type:complete